MANWQVLEFTGNTLVRLIQRRCAELVSSSQVLVQQATVANFSQFVGTTRPVITVFLYQVVENSNMRNAAQRTLPDGSRARQPLPLELCYMVTAWSVRSQEDAATDAAAAAEEQRLLGLVMQTFYDFAEVSRIDLVDDGASAPVWTSVDSLQILLDSLPIEDQYRIWDSGEAPYRLSLTYRVRVLALDPLEQPRSSRVVSAGMQIGDRGK